MKRRGKAIFTHRTMSILKNSTPKIHLYITQKHHGFEKGEFFKSAARYFLAPNLCVTRCLEKVNLLAKGVTGCQI